MKKVLKIAGITVSILLILLIAIPFLFQSKTEDILKNYINKNLNAKVEFSDVSLSFISSFPKAQLSVSDLSITTFEPFKDETLLTSKAIKLTLPIKEVFKSSGDEPLTINSIYVDEALVTLKTDKFGNVNYDIAKKDSTATESSEDSSGFTFDIEDYKLTNSALTYIDEGSNTAIHISEFNHNGNGTFSAETSELDTHTEANVSFESDSTRYLNNNHIKLDALIGLDLENSVYTFKDNKGFINQLPLEFKGFVKLLDNGQEVDITFENPESSFKNFLAIVPEAYAKNLDNVETSGDFKVKGIVKGMVTEETIPTIDISIASNNASFKYPDLPKRVENIVIDTSIKNETGKTEDTYVDIKTLNFKIDQDAFKSSMVLKNLTTNMLVNANIDGTLNLGNIKKVYPVTLENELSGILKGNLQTAFDMKALETNAYERIKTSGDVSISDFIFSSEDIVNPIHISTAAIKFNPETVNLNSFKAQTGDSDLNATGTLKNLIGFLLSDSKLQGNFNLTSNNFAVSDFMVADEAAEAENKTTEASES
ncbi:MAG TPA: hypothetical protein VKZ97_07255, partial [Flavobacteriaceae bacterium]|nr:hypothetical protein [Flavobacteriaceae bacterium]